MLWGYYIMECGEYQVEGVYSPILELGIVIKLEKHPNKTQDFFTIARK